MSSKEYVLTSTDCKILSRRNFGDEIKKAKKEKDKKDNL